MVSRVVEFIKINSMFVDNFIYRLEQFVIFCSLGSHSNDKWLASIDEKIVLGRGSTYSKDFCTYGRVEHAEWHVT